MRTLTSLLAMSCAIGLVEGSGEQKSNEIRRTERPLQTVALEIGQALLEENIDDIDEQTVVSRMLILTGELILCQGDATVQAQGDLMEDEQCEKRLAQLSTLNHALACREGAENTGIEHLSNLLCAISSCYARATSSNALDILRRTLDRLMSPQNGRLRSCTRFVNRFALDTAMLFSQETPSREASAYVQALETITSSGARRRASTTQNVPEESPATTGKPGLRWEPGISEWIASTPASLVRLKRLSLGNTFQEGKDSNTALPDIVDSIRRPTVRPYQPFAVVMPPMPLSSSPTKPGRGFADTEVKKRHLYTNTHQIIGAFEDSGVFVEPDGVAASFEQEDQDEEKEAGAETRKIGSRNNEPSMDWASGLKRAHDEHVAEERVRKELKRKTRHANIPFQSRFPASKPTTSTRQQHADRHTVVMNGKGMPRASTPRFVPEDESEDELSMHGIECDAGAADDRARASLGAAPLLGQAVTERPTKRRRSKR